MPRVAVYTLGCKVNQADSAAMIELFRQSGYEAVDFAEPADVYIVNTCVVTNTGEKKSRQAIRRAVRKSPGALVVIAGCYPQTAPDDAEKLEGVGLVVGARQRGDIVRLVEKARREGKIAAVSDFEPGDLFEDLTAGQVENRTRGFLKIQEGCNQFCSYCVIPYARGPLRSRPAGSISREAQRLAGQGFKEIVLIGIHLGAYGLETPGGPRLADAVETALGAPGVERLRLGSLESAEVSGRLLALMKQDDRFCRHLHLPLQSGCDEVLEAMNRPYRAGQFAALARELREAVPGLVLTTDVIAGFPGESEDMFQETLRFIAGADFAKVHVFPFSARRGTPAEKLAGQIPAKVKYKRAAMLTQAAESGRLRFLSGQVGLGAEVLLEQTAGEGMLCGFSGNYIKVFVAAEEKFLSKIVRVKLKGIYRDGLTGELV